MSTTLAAIIGGAAAGGVALVGILLLTIWYCICRPRNASRTSDTASSDPSVQVGRAVGIEFSLRDARRFGMDELSAATKNFSDKSLIGQGKFGEVYKGLLHDGILVALKKRPAPPTHEFIEEVRYLSSIQHRNLVTLLGYCQENDVQILVYEYIPNGSVSVHLYGASQVSQEKLEFKHRLQIALGAAKGLAHLHSLSPRLIHKDFKTANVLVDENFIAKVADAGLRNFLGRFDLAGTSAQVAADDVFLAPEASEFRRFSDKSDVYSFGVFLLELVSGQEAKELLSSDVNHNMVEWVQNLQEGGSISTIIDQRLGNSFTTEGMEEFMQLIVQCVNPSSERRSLMSYVVTELDRILEKEMSLTTIMGEGTPVVTLGSQLFMASK
ncbi:putative serine/threonine-protein kinase PBL3 isoform X1 [Salvia divinorum]|uniref:non-specific serine/threonine protein kinase n=1 Tax=Salvia divinorum TaxID=28513 RepID=A0ABD1G9S9_SALDI